MGYGLMSRARDCLQVFQELLLNDLFELISYIFYAFHLDRVKPCPSPARTSFRIT